MEPQADIALIGLAVMGQNLILNMNDHGFTVVAYNRTTEKVDHFLANEAKGTKVLGAHSIAEMVSKLKKPRRVMMLVKAGKPVDEFIEQLIPALEPGDIIIDGGNSLFEDTNRRVKYVREQGLALRRHRRERRRGRRAARAEHHARRFARRVAACEGYFPRRFRQGRRQRSLLRLGRRRRRGPLCEDGPQRHRIRRHAVDLRGLQHFENGLGLSADEMHEVFAEWNTGELDSYLIEISRDILAFKDKDGTPLVDKILDTAGQKGTGKWTVINSQDLGIPITLMAEAVYSRCVSALKDERVKAAKKLKGPRPALTSIAANPEKKKQFIADIRDALYASKIVSYAQGYMLMRAAAKEYGWNLNYGGIALMWRGGCIIRSRFLGKIKEAYDNNPKLTNLLLDDYFRGEIKRCAERLAQHRGDGGEEGHSGSRLQHRAGVLRPVSQRGFAGELVAGAAGLFWRAHLRARGQAARRIFPHQLDRPRRHDEQQHLQRVIDVNKRRLGRAPPIKIKKMR